jgi:hypothetical protein
MSIAILSVEGKFYWKCEMCNQKSASLYEHKSVAKAKSASHAMTNKHILNVSAKESTSIKEENKQIEKHIIDSVNVQQAILDNYEVLDRGNAFRKHDLKQRINECVKDGDELKNYSKLLDFCNNELNIKIDYNLTQAIVSLDDIDNVEENSEQYKFNFAIAILMKEIENHDIFDYRDLTCHKCRYCLVNSDIERDELLKENGIEPHDRPKRWKDEKYISHLRQFIRRCLHVNKYIKELCMLSFQDTDLNKCVFDYSINRIDKITHVSNRSETMNKTKYYNPVIITDNLTTDSDSSDEETYDKGDDNWTSMIKQATTD